MTPVEVRVRALLVEVMDPAAVDEWIDRWQFRGMSARELLDAGRGEVVEARARFIREWTA